MMLATLLSILFVCVSSDSRILVTTKTGQPVQGHQVHSQDPRSNTSITFASFQTIPFAKPPVGDLRSMFALIPLLFYFTRSLDLPPPSLWIQARLWTRPMSHSRGCVTSLGTPSVCCPMLSRLTRTVSISTSTFLESGLHLLRFLS